MREIKEEQIPRMTAKKEERKPHFDINLPPARYALNRRTPLPGFPVTFVPLQPRTSTAIALEQTSPTLPYWSDPCAQRRSLARPQLLRCTKNFRECALSGMSHNKERGRSSSDTPPVGRALVNR